MTFAVQHLSDEAIAACADGVLSAGAGARAARHLAECAECAAEVAAQRDAVRVLRTTPAPALPSGLLDRLRALPDTTPLDGRTVALAPDGTAVFPAFGTVLPTTHFPTASESSATASRPASRLPFARRSGMGLLTAAAAVVAISAVASAGSVGAHGGSSPEAPARIVPAGLTTANVTGSVPMRVDPAAFADVAGVLLR